MACLCPILASQRGDAFAERLPPSALLHSRLSTAAFLPGFVLGVSAGLWAAFESSSQLGVRLAPQSVRSSPGSSGLLARCSIGSVLLCS